MHQPESNDIETSPLNVGQLRFSRSDTLQTLDRVEQALAARRTPARPGTSLGMIFKTTRSYCTAAETLSDAQWLAAFPPADQGQRVAKAIEAALSDPGAYKAIHRITTSSVDLSNPTRSPGKDALWELDLFRRFDLGGIGVRFGEPDLVVPLKDAGLDYSVACKKIYSLKAVKHALKRGAEQVIDSGRHGVVALNIDHLQPLSLVHASDHQSLAVKLQAIHQGVIDANLRLFQQAVGEDQCDGILISKAIAMHLPAMDPPYQLCWSTFLWGKSAPPSATPRISGFARCLDAALRVQARVSE